MTTALTYVLAVICAGTRSFLTKQNGKTGGVDAQFNLMRAFSALLLFGVLSLIFGFEPHLPSILYGAVYGLLFFGSCICGLRALALGPLSITSSIVAFSLVIPCMYGALILGEEISVGDAGGFVLIVAATLLMNSTHKKKNDSNAQFKKGWALYLVGTVLFDGVRATIQTVHQRSYPGLYRYEFMLIAMLVGTLLFAIMSYRKREEIKNSEAKSKVRCTIYGTCAGIANGLYNYFILALAASEGATVLFPILSVTTMAASLALGKIIFKEKLSLLQALGVLAAMLAIFLIKL